MNADPSSNGASGPPAEAPAQPARPVTAGRIVPAGGWTQGSEAEAESSARRLAMFVVETPRRRLQDLVVSDSTRQQLRALLTKIKYQRVLYDDFGLGEVDPDGGRTAINLYGPPGTGKSFAA